MHSKHHANPTPTLFSELQLALSKIDSKDLKEWGFNSASRLPLITMRRIKGIGSLAKNIASGFSDECKDAFSAWKLGRLGVHLEKRAAVGIDGSIDLYNNVVRTVELLGKALILDPKANAPGVLALALGFYTGSGGQDGNGGVPDTDIAMFGIGDHRSLFTHSIISGIVIEASILALADLAGIVCEKIPRNQRDPFWDKLNTIKVDVANQLSASVSAGIAYHLAVDGILQPAPYHDLPFSAPIEAHQAIFNMFAATEALDVVKRMKNPTETKGAQIVGVVADGLGAAKDGFLALIRGR